jgi:hypothetical protein
LSGLRNIADSINKLQTCYFLLHRRREEGDRTDLGRDYEGAELCPCGGDCRFYEVTAVRRYRVPFLWKVRAFASELLITISCHGFFLLLYHSFYDIAIYHYLPLLINFLLK